MKSVIRILGMVLSLMLVFSCRKHANDSNSGYNGPTLSQVVIWNIQQPRYGVEVFDYYYDNLNRVTEIDHTTGDSTNSWVQAMYRDTTKWFYNGNEQQPYKNTGIGIGQTKNVSYFLYDNQGRLVKDSLITANCNCYYVKKYNWSGNKIIAIGTSGSYSGGIYSTAKDSIVINNDNYLWNFRVNDPADMSGSSFAYDNKMNPLHTLNIHSATSFTTIGGVPTAGYSKNNITTLTNGLYEAYTGKPVQNTQNTTTYKYNYNTNNLPVDGETSNRAPNNVKIRFTYTN
jgi:hypothetical protein